MGTGEITLLYPLRLASLEPGPTKQPQILQQAGAFFKQIAALAQDEEWGDPQEYDIR
jgi:hypothetical protein